MKRKKSSVPLHKGPNDSAVPPKLAPATSGHSLFPVNAGYYALFSQRCSKAGWAARDPETSHHRLPLWGVWMLTNPLHRCGPLMTTLQLSRV